MPSALPASVGLDGDAVGRRASGRGTCCRRRPARPRARRICALTSTVPPCPTATRSRCRSCVKPSVDSEGIAHTGLARACGSTSTAPCRSRSPAAGCVGAPLRSIQRPSQPVLTLTPSWLAVEPEVGVVEVAERVLRRVDRGHDREVRAVPPCRRRRACRSRTVASPLSPPPGVDTIAFENASAALRDAGRAASSRRAPVAPCVVALAAVDRRRARPRRRCSRRSPFGHDDVQAVVAARQVEQHAGSSAAARRPPRRPTPRPAPSRAPWPVDRRDARRRPTAAAAGASGRAGERPAGKPSSAAYGIGSVCVGRSSRTRASSISSHSMQRTLTSPARRVRRASAPGACRSAAASWSAAVGAGRPARRGRVRRSASRASPSREPRRVGRGVRAVERRPAAVSAGIVGRRASGRAP